LIKILCVEDELELRADLVEELQDAGYETIEASNGVEGLDSILEHHPDLVLCDITMPGMNGHELLAQLRAEHPQFNCLPFLFLSALADREDIVAGKELGADDYLTKPVDFDILLATVRSRLGQVTRMDAQKQEELNSLRASVLNILPHELRTPLNHILGYSSCIKDEMFGPLDNEKYKHYAELVHEGGSQLHSIVEDVLIMVDAAAGVIKPSYEHCQLSEIIDSCVAEVKEEADHNAVELDVHVAPDLPQFQTDRELVKRAIISVLSNAIKFSKETGEVKIRALSEDEGTLVIQVIDSGIGIDDVHINVVLQPFEQVKKGLERTYEGIGLGLPIAKYLTEILGGQFYLESEMGIGTKVEMHFPPTRGSVPSVGEG